MWSYKRGGSIDRAFLRKWNTAKRAAGIDNRGIFEIDRLLLMIVS